MLAAVTVCSVDQAVPLAGTRVHGIVLLAATEETLAAFTGDNSIVDSRGLVPTDLTGDDLDLSSHFRCLVFLGWTTKTRLHVVNVAARIGRIKRWIQDAPAL